MRYYIIAGEASGDLHASNLIHALKKHDQKAEVRAWGGDKMMKAGAEVVKHYRDLAFMGFLEVILNLPTILRNFGFCKRDIEAFNPDVIIFVDYPGFNLRMASWAKRKGYRTFYYISPQVWAWKSSRVKGIKKWVDEMFVILPFEKEFYDRYDYEVHFVGHPLLDVVDSHEVPDVIKNRIHPEGKPVIALLPGSRKQEIESMLPVMLRALDSLTDYRIAIAGAPSIPRHFYNKIISEFGDQSHVEILEDKTYSILAEAHAALVTSGTATLETALFNVPEIVLYKGNWLSFQLAKRLVKVEYISLVNLIAEKELVPELIQNNMNVDNIRSTLNEILSGPKREMMLDGYTRIRERLGGPGASERCANLMIKKLKS